MSTRVHEHTHAKRMAPRLLAASNASEFARHLCVGEYGPKIIISHFFFLFSFFVKTLTCQPPPFILNYSIYTPLQEHEGVLWPFVKEAIGQRL